jgi:hypothetical protein
MNMDWKPGRDMYVGLGCGFVLILAAAFFVGVPLGDLALWAAIFVAAGVTFVQILKRSQNKK